MTQNLADLIPVPAGIRHQDGPKVIHDAGSKMHFFVSGTPHDVMSAYRDALAAAGWTVTGDAGSHGGTFRGSNAAGNHIVATGGGHGHDVDVNVAVWPSKPQNDHV